jgi:hypothetical protein
MKLKLFVLVFCVLQLTSADLTSSQWELQKVRDSLVQRQNRVKKAVTGNIARAKSTLSEIGSSVKLNLTRTALTNLKDHLDKVVTVSSFQELNLTVKSCNEVTLRASEIIMEIQKCIKIRHQIDLNASLLLVQRNNLNTAAVLNKANLTPNQKTMLQNISTSLFINYDEYYQNVVTLNIAVYQYLRIRAQLLTAKKVECKCPAEMSANGTATFVKIDKNVQTIINSVDVEEKAIRSLSNNLISKISSVINEIKSNTKLASLLKAFNDVLILVNGFSVISTTARVNVTKTCDDAAMKVVFIQYYTEFYFQTNYEAKLNLSLAAYTLSIMNSNIATSSSSLTEAQKTDFKIFMTYQTNMTEAFRKYILATALAFMKLPLQLRDAKAIRTINCNCSQNSLKLSGSFETCNSIS